MVPVGRGSANRSPVSRWMLAAAAASAIAFTLLVLLALAWSSSGRPGPAEDRDPSLARAIVDIERRLAVLEARIEGVRPAEKTPARWAEPAPPPGAEDRLARVEARLAALEAPVAAHLRDARRARIESDLRAILHAAELYEACCGTLPPTLDALASGKCEDPSVDSGVVLEATKDPWGNEYRYELGPNGRPRARCLGEDGAVGGAGEGEDVEAP